MEMESSYVIKFFVKEAMKGVEIIDRLNPLMVGVPSECKSIPGSRR
jgi:hypothetical protein